MKIIITIVVIFVFISCEKTEFIPIDSDEYVDSIEDDNETDVDVVFCKGDAVDASSDMLSFLGPASQKITISGDCGSTVTIVCSIGMAGGINMCNCACVIDDISWGDNGSGDNVYNRIDVFSGSNGNNKYLDQWTPETFEKKIWRGSESCQVGHSIYTAVFYFVFK